jgi:crotonobetainyl-CoA:carnitine CoA-transferase CaiB-like acyl-CoA transferase
MIPRIDFDPTAPAPLDGVRVVDLSRLVAGNMVSLQLADQGAEVIKVEDPKTGDPLRAWRVMGLSLHWKVYSRNKKSLAINLRQQAGSERAACAQSGSRHRAHYRIWAGRAL